MRQLEVEKVAETHFFLRPVLAEALRNTPITAAGQAIVGPFASYADYWQDSFAERFFDMATFVRLGSALEGGLRSFHRSRSSNPAPDDRIFQRLVPGADLVALVHADTGHRLDTNGSWQMMQELMVCRHLYAHRSGLADQRFVSQFALVSGQDLTSPLKQMGYPDQEVYWFEPLSRLGAFIEAARAFFRDLP